MQTKDKERAHFVSFFYDHLMIKNLELEKTPLLFKDTLNEKKSRCYIRITFFYI